MTRKRNFMNKQYNLLQKEIKQIISKSPVKTDLNHAKTTVKLVKQLKPNADDAFLIAALAHDIERCFLTDRRENAEKFDNYEEYKRLHAEKGAKIVSGLMKKYGFDKNFTSKVENLVKKHEFGGDKESNLLMDADTISFFIENLDNYIKDFGIEKAKKKIDFMFNRIMSEEARQIANPMYEDAIKKLGY